MRGFLFILGPSQDHPFKAKNQCLWSDKNEYTRQTQKIRGCLSNYRLNPRQRPHRDPSALALSISEEVEIRNLGWVSHLLFNHHDPQMQ